MAAKPNPTPLPDLIRKLNGTAEALLEVQLPGGGEHHYYSNFASYSERLREGLANVQQMLNTCEAMVRPRSTAPPDFSDADDVAEWTSSLLDDVLERLDAAMDAERARGTNAGKHGRGGQGDDDAAAAAAAGGLDDAALMSKLPSFGGAAVRAARQRGPIRHAAGLARPQDAFDPPPDNRPDTPWRPRTGHLVGLTAAPLDPAVYDTAPGAPEAYPHPFRTELEALSYTPEQLRAPAPPPLPPRAPEDTPLVWVNTPEALEAMVSELEPPSGGEEADGEAGAGQEPGGGGGGVYEIAVDLEQHSYRSYQGFTCLMQISTRTTDYVVDTLALRNQLGPALARVFADPRVVKVLHGADQDVEWLQRDHGLYIINMFDTGQASRVLALPSNGLAYLLETLCGFQADKRYQLADWRLRPLSTDMLHYARCDTHYLLYVYDKLREQLLATPEERIPSSLVVPLPSNNPGGALGLVLERSRQLCLKTYHKPSFSLSAYQDTLLRWGLTMNPQQTSVFAALLSWRDRVCRAEDESPGYVLPKAQLVALSQAMPESAKRVQAVLGRAVSEVVARRVAEVVSAIAEARHRSTDPLHPQRPAAAAVVVEAAAATTAAAAPANANTAVAAAPRSLPALKPRAVAPIKTVKAASTAAAAALAVHVTATATAAPAPATAAVTLPAAAAVNPLPGRYPGGGSSSSGTTAGPGSVESAPAASEPQVGTSASAAPAAAAAAGATEASHGVAGGGLKPRVLKPPAVAASRTAALFGGSAASVPAAGVATQADEGNGAAAAGDAAAATTVVQHTTPVVGARPAAAILRPGKASVLGAMFGGGAIGGGGGVAARQRLPAAAAAVAGPFSKAREADVGDDEDEEVLRAQQRAKRLRATFALPFVAAAASPAAAAAGGTTAAVAGKGAPAEVEDDAEVKDGKPATRRNTAADIRAAVEAMQAEGDVDIVMGPDGQGVQVPAGAAAAHAAAAAAGADSAGAGEGAAAAAGGGGRAVPAARRVDLVSEEGDTGDEDADEDEDDEAEEQEDGDVQVAEAVAGGDEEESGRSRTAVGDAAGGDGPGGGGGGRAGGGGGSVATVQVAGSQLGLDVLEYVPLPLSQMFPKAKAGGKKRGGGAGSLREARGGTRRAATKRLFITEVPAGVTATAAAGTAEEYDMGASSGSDGDSDGDGGHTVGPFAKKRRKAAVASPKKQQQGGALASPDDDAGVKAKGGRGRGSGAGRSGGRRGGRSSSALTGLLADFPRSNLSPSAPSDERGGGRGRGGDRGGRRGGRGVGSGRQPTAFNPYDIPDEFLLKGGKRSAVMPRSGNRSFTFK